MVKWNWVIFCIIYTIYFFKQFELTQKIKHTIITPRDFTMMISGLDCSKGRLRSTIEQEIRDFLEEKIAKHGIDPVI